MEYQVLLEGKQVKKNQVTGMHLMAGFLLLVMGFITWLVPDKVKQEQQLLLNIAGILCSLFGLSIVFISIFLNKRIIQGKGNFILRIAEAGVLGAIIIYSLLQQWYLPAAYSGAGLLGIILAYYWEKNGKKTRTALFNDEGITIPGLGRKTRMRWQELNRILLRHHILTVDCHDNKLFQLPIDRNRQLNFDKEEFEQYCTLQIAAKKHLQQKDW